MHPFRLFINKYCDLPDQEWLAIESKLYQQEYSQGDMLLEEGKVCKHLYFLASGFLRFSTLKAGVSVTKFFTDPPYTFTSQRSFTQKTPAQEGIEALEDSIVWTLKRSDVYQLLELPGWASFSRQLVQEVQYYTEQILVDIQNKTAEERYIEMIETNSIYLEKVPLKHIASYLGIAPQSLSRIRKNYYENRKLT